MIKNHYFNEIKKTLTLATPLIIGQLGHMLMGVVDSLMVGRLGAEPLAASSLVHGLFMLIIIIGYGVSLGVTPITAMTKGAGGLKECGVILRQGLLVNMTAGVVLTVVMFFAADLIRFLNQPEGIVDQSISFMKILSCSVIPYMLFQSYRQFAEGLSVMRPAMIIMLSANLVNVLANWMFIYGNLGMPALGLNGAGIATTCSRLFMAACMIWFVMGSRSMKPYDPSLRFKGIDVTIIRKLLKIGLPAGFQWFFEISAFAGSAVIIGWLGTKELAAHQIALNLASVTYMFALGISSAASVRVATAVGTNQIPSTRIAGFSALLLGMVVMGCFGVVFVLFRNFLPTLYVADPEVIKLAGPLLIIAALFQISDGAQVIGLGALRGIADMKVPTIITMLAYWVVCLPLGYVLGFKFGLGVHGVWLGFVAGLTSVALLAAFRFNQRSRMKVSI